jgi:CIC family chloride channel protein
MRQRFLRLPRKTRWLQPVAGGVMVGLMGWFVPQVLGVGYSYVGLALDGTMAFKLMVLLIVLKLFAITTCYASGNAGGIFGPALFLGAMLGGAIGTVAHHFLPAYTAAPGAYALVGMGALFAGIVRAPMTSVLMIFEMTRDYAVIVPLMIANLASLFISTRFQKEPIYEALARQDGIHLPSPKTREEFGRHTVHQVMRDAPRLLPAKMSVHDAAERMQSSEFRTWLVEDGGEIVGVLSAGTVESALVEGRAGENLMSLCDSLEFPHVHPDHPLTLALERMSKAHLDILPVVNRANVHKLEGIVTLRDVLGSYGVDSAEPS